MSSNTINNGCEQDEEALCKERALAKSVLETAQAIVLVLDKEGHIVYFNPYLEEISGYCLEDVKGKDWFGTFLSPPIQERVRTFFRSALGGIPTRGTFDPIITRDGRELLIEWYDKTLRSADGSIEGLLAIGQNVTDKKKAEEALRRSEQKYRNIFDNAAMGIFQVTVEGRFISANNHAARILGYESGEDLIQSIRDINTQIYQDPKTSDKVKRFLQENGVLENFEVPFYHKDGHTVWVSLTAQLIRNADGTILYHEGTIQDITGRKRAELELVSAQQRLNEVHRLAHIGTWDWVMETDTVTWSGELYNIAGRDPLLPAPTYAEHPQVYAPASWDRLSSAVNRALTSGEPYYLELELVRPDGSIRWVNAIGGVKRDLDEKIIGLYGTVQDITKGRRNEMALHESEEKLSRILNDISDVVWSLSWPDMKVYYLSPSVEKLYGRPVQEFIDKPSLWAEITHPDDKQISENALEQLRKEGSALRECRIVRPDGTIVWIHDKSKFIFDEHDMPIRVDGISSDITGRKQAEEALRSVYEQVIASEKLLQQQYSVLAEKDDAIQLLNRDLEKRVEVRMIELMQANENLKESEEKYHAVFENANDAILLIAISPDGLPGKFLEVNETACRRMKYTREEFLQLSVREIDAPETWEKIRENFKNLMENGYATFEGIHITKEGKRIPVEINAHTFSLHGQGLLLAHVRDITERKAAEERLKKTQTDFRSLISNSADIIAVLDLTGDILFLSPSFGTTLGYRDKKTVFGNAFDLIHLDDARATRETMQAKAEHPGETHGIELRLRHADGSWRTMEVIGNISSWGGHDRVFIINARDITGRKRAEEQIRASLEEKIILLREIHHRVRNNFQIILSLFSLQSRSIGDEKFSRAMLESQNRIRAMAFVHETLYSSADFAHIDLESYAKFLTTQLFTFFKVRPGIISLILDIKNIYTDINTAIPLGLVINELVSNSLKHAFPDGRRGRITLSILDDQKGFTLTYQDDGVGFSKGFDWQTTESLGFKLIRVLIDQLDGTIEREPAEGTCFIIRVMKKTNGRGQIHGTFNPVPE